MIWTDSQLDVVKRKLDAAEEDLSEAKSTAENALCRVASLERKNRVAVTCSSKVIEHYEPSTMRTSYYSKLAEQRKLVEPAKAVAGPNVFHTIENGMPGVLSATCRSSTSFKN